MLAKNDAAPRRASAVSTFTTSDLSEVNEDKSGDINSGLILLHDVPNVRLKTLTMIFQPDNMDSETIECVRA